MGLHGLAVVLPWVALTALWSMCLAPDAGLEGQPPVVEVVEGKGGAGCEGQGGMGAVRGRWDGMRLCQWRGGGW